MVLIFGKDSCPYTQAALADHRRRGVEYEYINVRTHPSELQRMLKYSKGQRCVPVIVDDDEVIVGFGGT